ncbi:uncharacterized protein TNCV_4720501 [Trichonephila clavipes]|uniref:Uncharacterized protein n=1 Tax=Trichonephila clavipes TaxID=2585209 RepID=A0A8X6W6P0_TRICX|nr:uncharacterized protein TNCV_4720501 [Trichonephila clavipes]
MPLDNKCRIGPLAGAPPDTCAVVISTETESGFITEDDTSPVCHTPSCPRSAKIQSTLPMMWGQCDVVGAEVATLLIARSSRSFVFLGRSDPPRRYTLPSVIHCCQHRATTISLQPRWRPIRLFDPPASLRRPYQSPSAARRLRLRGILSLNIVY